VELAYPKRRGEIWLRGRWFPIVVTVFVLDVLFGLFLFNRVTGYTPEPIQIGFALIIAALLSYAAHRLERGWAINVNKPVRRPLYYLLYTFFGSIVCAIVFYVLPNLVPTAGGPLLIVVMGVTLILLLLSGLKFNWRISTGKHRLAICVGSLMVLVLLTPIQELDKSGVDNARGMMVVGLVAVILLLSLNREISERSHVERACTCRNMALNWVFMRACTPYC